MKVSVILGHPYPRSFNHAIAQAVVERLQKNGYDVFFHDLYEEGFDPVMTGHELVNSVSQDELVEQHCAEIKQAHGIIVIHPNWWGQPPAILKGWVDRVLRLKLAYDSSQDEDGVVKAWGLLQAEQAMVFNTSNTPGEIEEEVLGDPLETIWKNCTFKFCGVSKFYRKMFRIIETSTLEQRELWLEQAKEAVDQCFPKPN